MDQFCLPNINVILSMFWIGFYDDYHIRPPYRAKAHGLARDIPIDDERLFKFQQRNPYSDNSMKKDDTELLCSSSSAHAAVHFAYIIGGNPIVLLGCDCCSEDGKNYYMDFPGQPKDEFSPLIDQWDNSEAHVVTHNSTWKDVADANPHVPIVNASGGRLDCFKRVKLEDINND